MENKMISRRGLLALALAAGAAGMMPTPEAQAGGGFSHQASTARRGVAKHHDSVWSYNVRARRKHPGRLTSGPRKHPGELTSYQRTRPCAARPGHPC